MATLLRRWLDEAGLRVDDIHKKLTPDHFTDRRVPSRSTLSDRLAGVALRQDFIEAVADICSPSEAVRQQLLEDVHAARKRARTAGTVPSTSAGTEAHLVIVQQRSLEVSDRLLRALERQQQLERERNDANQMVLILLAMVDKLQRDITTLNRERDRLRVVDHAEENLAQVYERLAKSEQQRETAETELTRAKDERQKADQLAEEAAEQVRLLTEELERLRGEALDSTASAEAEAAVPDVRTPLDVDADDIDLALTKAAQHLDDRAGRLDQLASELHLDNPPDISLTSNDAVDNSSDPELVDPTPEEVVDEVRTLVLNGDDEAAEAVLRLSGQTLPLTEVLRAAILLRDTNLPDEAAQLLHFVIERTGPSEMPSLVRELRVQEQDAELYELLNQVARRWPSWDITAVVDALRAEAQDSAAFQMLRAVGRLSPATEVSMILTQVSDFDADWVVDAACKDRPLEEMPVLAQELRLVRGGVAAKIAAAYEERRGAASPESSIASLPRLASLLVDNGGEEGEDEFQPLVRPYAMAGGDMRRPGRSLPVETVVRTTAAPDQFMGLLPELQSICRICRDPHDISAIADRLGVPLGVARIFVADLAEAGLVEIDAELTATSPAEVQVNLPPAEEAIFHLAGDGQLDHERENDRARVVEARLDLPEEAEDDQVGFADAVTPARRAFAGEVNALLIQPLLDAGMTRRRIRALVNTTIPYATLRRVSQGRHLPGPKGMEAVMEVIGQQQALSEQAHTRLMTAYLRVLREEDPELYERYVLEDQERRRLSVSTDQAAHNPDENH